MLIIRLKGGLGNQLFQYAMGRKLSKLSGEELKFDIGATPEAFQKNSAREYMLGFFNTKGSIASSPEVRRIKYPFGIFSKVGRALAFWVFKIHNIDYHPRYLGKKGNVYLDGFWQSEKYFLDIRQELLSELTLRNSLSAKGKKVETYIATAEHPVSLHVRRGDYIQDPGTNRWHGNICTLEYYANAISIMTEKLENPTFFIFSDDIEWVKENLKCPQPAVCVSDYALEPHEDLVLMSRCQHHIIANSSFSWWGAWLNPHEKKMVIAPSKWTNKIPTINPNILPKSWIQI